MSLILILSRLKKYLHIGINQQETVLRASEYKLLFFVKICIVISQL